MPMVLCEGVRCGRGTLGLYADREVNLPPQHAEPRFPLISESRDKLGGPYDGMFLSFTIAPVKYKWKAHTDIWKPPGHDRAESKISAWLTTA